MSEKYIDGLVQERRNYSALTMELRLCCLNPSMYTTNLKMVSSIFQPFWPLTNEINIKKTAVIYPRSSSLKLYQWLLLLTWININLNIDK